MASFQPGTLGNRYHDPVGRRRPCRRRSIQGRIFGLARLHQWQPGLHPDRRRREPAIVHRLDAGAGRQPALRWRGRSIPPFNAGPGLGRHAGAVRIDGRPDPLLAVDPGGRQCQRGAMSVNMAAGRPVRRPHDNRSAQRAAPRNWPPPATRQSADGVRSAISTGAAWATAFRRRRAVAQRRSP